MGKYYIYKHTRLDKNEPFYIGRGTKSKRNYTTKKSIYGRAYNKSGRCNMWKGIISRTEYEVSIVFESDDFELVKEKEIELVSLYGRKIQGTGTLVNITEGGESCAGYEPTQEQCKAISERQLGEKNHMFGKKGALNPLFGKSKSKEHVDKIVKAKHEKYFNEVVDTETGEIFRNPRCASEACNINLNTLRHYLNGTRVNPTKLEYKNK